MATRTILFTVAALLAFAGNSLLCRVALAEAHIDAATFTGVRLVTGALMLAVLAAGRMRRDEQRGLAGNWASAGALVLYAAPFSFAYLELGAGIGALVLFGAVQATMVAWGIARGERPRPLVWLGLAIAIAGLVGLTLPSAGGDAPDLLGTLVMVVAGVGWGAYSLRGRTAKRDPLVETAGNFVRSVPFAIVLVVAYASAGTWQVDATGLVLAAISGAITSGIGYTLWYAALRGLTATRAAIVQLLVPVVAAVGGIVLLDEAPTLRLVLAGTAILVGVATAMRGRT